MFGVFTFTLFNTLSCQNYFSRGYGGGGGGVQNSSGNSGGVGGYFSGQKMEIPRRRGGLRESPSVVGIWIFSGTTHCHLLIPISIYIITMNAHALIGQAAMVYCAGNNELLYKRNTPQVSMVYRLIRIRKSLRLMIYEFFECSTNIPRGLSAYKP